MNAVTLHARCLNAVTASTLQRCSPLYIKGGSAALLAAFPTLEAKTFIRLIAAKAADTPPREPSIFDQSIAAWGSFPIKRSVRILLTPCEQQTP
jgi:hypothetical protein